MPLSAPASRQLRHQRVIRATAYERDDGLWDIDACVTDHKTRDAFMGGSVRPNGMPIHELWLRITIDRSLNIVDAESSSDWAPYGSECQKANAAYRTLIGLNLRQQFRREVREKLSGIAGCAHLTELCNILPTAAIQAFAGDVWETGESRHEGKSKSEGSRNPHEQGPGAALQQSPADEGNTPPFQLGRCHALRFDGEVVRQFYPRWYGHAPCPPEREDQ
jgi:hypothetical protein